MLGWSPLSSATSGPDPKKAIIVYRMVLSIGPPHIFLAGKEQDLKPEVLLLIWFFEWKLSLAADRLVSFPFWYWIWETLVKRSHMISWPERESRQAWWSSHFCPRASSEGLFIQIHHQELLTWNQLGTMCVLVWLSCLEAMVVCWNKKVSDLNVMFLGSPWEIEEYEGSQHNRGAAVDEEKQLNVLPDFLHIEVFIHTPHSEAK